MCKCSCKRFILHMQTGKQQREQVPQWRTASAAAGEKCEGNDVIEPKPVLFLPHFYYLLVMGWGATKRRAIFFLPLFHCIFTNEMVIDDYQH